MYNSCLIVNLLGFIVLLGGDKIMVHIKTPKLYLARIQGGQGGLKLSITQISFVDICWFRLSMLSPLRLEV